MYSTAAYEARLENRRQELCEIERMRFYRQIGLARPQARRSGLRVWQLAQTLLSALFGR